MILLIILARECYNMLITKARLRQIIKEELESLKETEVGAVETIKPEMPFVWVANTLNPVIIQREVNDAFTAKIIDRSTRDAMSNVLQGFRKIKNPSDKDNRRFAEVRIKLENALSSAPGAAQKKYKVYQKRHGVVRKSRKDLQQAVARNIAKSQGGGGALKAVTASGDGLPKR